MKSKVLRGCKFLVDFLREQDQYKFGYDLSVKEQSKGPKKVKQIKTLTGEILCEASDMAKQFTENFTTFNNEYQRINHQISHRCKAVEKASKTLAHQYFGLSTELDNLQKLVLKHTEIPQFSNLYQRMSDLIRMTGELSVHQGFMINDTLNSQFKYQREQGRTSFMEAHLLVLGSDFKYEKQRKMLDGDKFKLFKKQDYEQWQIQDPALIKEVYKVRGNYEESKQYMLPERTQRLTEMQDECQYFKQQLFNEVRRTIMLDYMSSRENFNDVGEQYTNHLNLNMKEWQKFISFYSDLNNARKEKDDEYKRDQFIGEELDWKMLADNLTLFQSQMNDLQELRGFEDPNMSLAMDQSLMVDSNTGYNSENDRDPFKAGDISMVGPAPSRQNNFGMGGQQNFQRQNTGSLFADDVKPHPNMLGNRSQSV